jgi:hypothetical protein
MPEELIRMRNRLEDALLRGRADAMGYSSTLREAFAAVDDGDIIRLRLVLEQCYDTACGEWQAIIRRAMRAAGMTVHIETDDYFAEPE